MGGSSRPLSAYVTEHGTRITNNMKNFNHYIRRGWYKNLEAKKFSRGRASHANTRDARPKAECFRQSIETRGRAVLWPFVFFCWFLSQILEYIVFLGGQGRLDQFCGYDDAERPQDCAQSWNKWTEVPDVPKKPPFEHFLAKIFQTIFSPKWLFGGNFMREIDCKHSRSVKTLS